jgi:benzodiazapine receptor
MKKRKLNLKILFISLLLVFGIGFIGSLFTSSNTNTDWYQSIRPSITPPNFVFPIVWNILFFLIALSLYYAWTSSKNKKDKINISLIFGLNLLLNALWSFLFFGLKNPKAGFIEIIAMDLSIVAMILITYKISKKSAWLLGPYLIWVSFASVINYLAAF